ncbi:MAG: hypothetical protein AAGH79_17735 [Bacteroidota bacterium]
MNRKRILSFLGITTFVFIGGLVSLILFPQTLFAHSYTHDQVTVYSNGPIDEGAFNRALDQANAYLNESELQDPSYRYDVFIAAGTPYNEFDNLVFGEWSVARAIANNVIIKRAVDLETLTVDNGHNAFDLVYVLTHEMVHCLQAHHFGMWTFNPFRHPPMWKLEGYPEYIARRPLLDHPEYELRQGITDFLARTQVGDDPTRIIQIAERESTPYIYYKGRLMVEYLMDIRGFSYTDILEDKRSEEEVYAEMLEWYGHMDPR